MTIYKRREDRIYTIMDFKDDEEIFFVSYPETRQSRESGNAWYKNKKGDINLINKNEIEILKG